MCRGIGLLVSERYEKRERGKEDQQNISVYVSSKFDVKCN